MNLQQEIPILVDAIKLLYEAFAVAISSFSLHMSISPPARGSHHSQSEVMKSSLHECLIFPTIL